MNTFFFITLAVSAVSTVIMLSMLVVLGFRARGRDGATVPDREEMRRHAMWGFLYVNPADARGWVPKLRGYGYTVNFRTRRMAILFAVVLFLLLASTAAMAILAPHLKLK